ncbi:hypothetical protein H4R19_001417, partial [Coemansia spiralis]
MSRLPRGPAATGPLRPPASGMTLPHSLGGRAMPADLPPLPAFTQRIPPGARRATLTTATFTPPPPSDGTTAPMRPSGIAAPVASGRAASPSPSASSDTLASLTVRAHTAPSPAKESVATSTAGLGASSCLPAGAQREASGDSGRQTPLGALPESAAGLRCGEPICIPAQGLRGTLRYLGPINGKPGVWAGVELHVAGTGKNDGSVAGKSYFTCPPASGIFVAPSKIEPLKAGPGSQLRSAGAEHAGVPSISSVLASTPADRAGPPPRRAAASSRTRPPLIAPATTQPARTRQTSITGTTGSAAGSPVASRQKTMSRPATVSRASSRTRLGSTADSAASSRTSPSPSQPNSQTLPPAAADCSVASPSVSRPQGNARLRLRSSVSSAETQPAAGAIAARQRPAHLAPRRQPETALVAESDTAQPKPGPASDPADRLRLRIEMLEAENRVLRLRSEQDKAHLTASQMLAKDLGAASPTRGQPAPHSPDGSAQQQLADMREALERERRAGAARVEQLEAQIAELRAAASTVDGRGDAAGDNPRLVELQSELEHTVASHAKELAEAHALHSELSSRLEQSTAKVAGLQTELDAKDDEVSALSANLNQRSADLGRAEQQCHDMAEERDGRPQGDQPSPSEDSTLLVARYYRHLAQLAAAMQEACGDAPEGAPDDTADPAALIDWTQQLATSLAERHALAAARADALAEDVRAKDAALADFERRLGELACDTAGRDLDGSSRSAQTAAMQERIAELEAANVHIAEERDQFAK